MKDNNSNDVITRSYLFSLLETFDTGKAIVAALAIGVLGYLANLLMSLYSFMYWNSYFECFNLPLQYFESAMNIESNFYGFVVAIPICIVYLLLQLKYNSCIRAALDRNPKPLIYWLLRSSTYYAILIVHLLFSFFLLIVLNGGNDFIVSLVISSSVMNTLISIISGVNIYNRNKESQFTSLIQDSGFRKAVVVIGITIFILSLYFVYMLGYFQKVILVDMPQMISVDNEETTQQYGKLLETDSSYICVPISFEKDNEHIMHIENSSYRVIPKEEIVTITETTAWVLYRDKGSGVLFDFIGYKEDAFFTLLYCSIALSVVLLYGEYFLFKKLYSENKNE
ncbi:MAG: hypothetical protein E7665_04765 [Ruminococcaceae bacterium]|nr:hypothetical protein [Oscillospiraceae bacterium]